MDFACEQLTGPSNLESHLEQILECNDKRDGGHRTLPRLVFRKFSSDIVKFDAIPQLCKSFLLFGVLSTLAKCVREGAQQASASVYLLRCAVR
jgi:hypothetical protein